jgi:hypothetical protein
LATPAQLYAEGGNYNFRIDGNVAICTVWRRPDLSFEEGAKLAVEISGHLENIVEGKVAGVTGIVLDIRKAPELVGKKTREAVGFVLARCEALAIRFAIVISTPTQGAIMEHVTKGGPPNFVRIARDIDHAMSWTSGKTDE